MAKPKMPLYYDDDSPAISMAIKVLLAKKYYIRRPSKFQLKLDDVNFYPTTGKITIDPYTVHNERGLKSLVDLLDNRKRLAFDQLSLLGPEENEV